MVASVAPLNFDPSKVALVNAAIGDTLPGAVKLCLVNPAVSSVMETAPGIAAGGRDPTVRRSRPPASAELKASRDLYPVVVKNLAR